jgi:hypothetical protein
MWTSRLHIVSSIVLDTMNLPQQLPKDITGVPTVMFCPSDGPRPKLRLGIIEKDIALTTSSLPLSSELRIAKYQVIAYCDCGVIASMLVTRS